MVRNIILVVFVLGVFSIKAQIHSEWRGIGRTGGYDQETNLLKKWDANGPSLLWYIDSIPKGYSSVAVAQNKVFFTGIIDTMDVLLAYSLKGNKLWQVNFGRAWDNSFEHSRCTPTVDGDRIYVSSGLGDVTCIKAVNGEMLWSVKAAEIYEGSSGRFGYSESLLVFNDIVVFTAAGSQTTMVAFNKMNGEMVWKTKSLKDAASYSSPLVINTYGKDLILNFTENYLFAVKPESGAFAWTFDFGSYAGGNNKRNNQTNTPLFYNNELFLSSGYDHKSVMLSIEKGADSVSVKWVDSVLDVHHGGLVQIDGYIYGANWLHNRMGNWSCLSWETGALKYSKEWGNKGSIIAADGMLYCYEEKNGVVGIAPVNPESFDIVSSFEVPYGEKPYWAHLVIDNGKLFVRSATAIMVYDIRKEN